MPRVSGEPDGNQSVQPTGTSLLEDTESLGPDERVAPTWTEPLVRSLSHASRDVRRNAPLTPAASP